MSDWEGVVQRFIRGNGGWIRESAIMEQGTSSADTIDIHFTNTADWQMAITLTLPGLKSMTLLMALATGQTSSRRTGITPSFTLASSITQSTPTGTRTRSRTLALPTLLPTIATLISSSGPATTSATLPSWARTGSGVPLIPQTPWTSADSKK